MFTTFSVTTPRAVRFMIAGLAVLLALTMLVVHQSRAQTTIADGDVQALITAIEDANSSSGSVTIELASSGDYELTAEYTGDSSSGNGLPAITSQITIEGNGATIRRVSDSDNFRIFAIGSDGDLDLEGVIVSGGQTQLDGGGIFNSQGNLTLTDSEIINNTALYGAGIAAHNNATIEIIDTHISGNASGYGGGGIYVISNSTVEVTDSVIDSNTATFGPGGGIYVSQGEVDLIRSTLDGNAALDGGGIYSSSGTLTLSNSTVSGNSATNIGSNGGGGGGIFNYEGDMTLTSSTISGNTATVEGGGILNLGNLMLTGSIVAGNTVTESSDAASTNISGSIDSNSESFIDGDPELGPLQDNGGPTETMMPMPGSPVINAIPLDNGECEVGETIDQRGVQRPAGDGCDIGSVEAPRPPLLTLPDDFSVSYDQRTNVTWSASATDWTGNSIAVTCDPASGSSFPVGVTTVQCEADEDSRGQSSSGSFVLTVMEETQIDFIPVDDPDNPFFWATWARTDLPVRDGHIPRTWMWGPGPFTSSIWEPYTTELQNPGGPPLVALELPETEREVIYFDKARMEINDPDGDSDSIWYVTNGLLVIEMITGNRQFGDDLFKQYDPSTSNVAGDADGTTGPTYATLQSVLDAPAQSVGTLLNGQIDSTGNVSFSSAWGNYGITVGFVDEVTNHGIAAPFWDFMNSDGLVHENGTNVEDALFENPFYATGRPVTEAYWADVKVANEQRDVLIQCFERRCLTYTPGNSPGFVVEAGNVGQHYYTWRYIQAPD